MPRHPSAPKKIAVSIGLLARNEETRLPATLASLFQQTLFADLAARGEGAEIWCVANACTDDTAAVAERIFREQATSHPQAAAFVARAVNLPAPGKINAWNVFVHEIAAAETRCLILLDADIRLGSPTTLAQLFRGLEEDARAYVTVGTPVKDLALKSNPTWRERLSLATSRLTQGSGPQLTGQLYAIRASVARRIRLPRDLAACDDGFIKNIVCTDFLLKETEPARLRLVPGASHVFEAYTGAGEILRNQKRQMIGQTFVHLLIDRFLPSRCQQEHTNLAELVERLDEETPGWLRTLMHAHVREARHFWRLFPGIATFRYTRWAARRRTADKVRHFPAMVAGTVVTWVAAWLAYRALRRGLLDYWPIKPGRPPESAEPLTSSLTLLPPAASA